MLFVRVEYATQCSPQDSEVRGSGMCFSAASGLGQGRRSISWCDVRLSVSLRNSWHACVQMDRHLLRDTASEPPPPLGSDRFVSLFLV